MSNINVCIVGVGNCASSLYQGIHYYSMNKIKHGLMSENIGGYKPKHIKREIAFHKSVCEQIFNRESYIINLKCIDITVTGRCLVKCKDCSNLMQYYVKPKNVELEPLFKNLDKLMKSIL